MWNSGLPGGSSSNARAVREPLEGSEEPGAWNISGVYVLCMCRVKNLSHTANLYVCTNTHIFCSLLNIHTYIYINIIIYNERYTENSDDYILTYIYI